VRFAPAQAWRVGAGLGRRGRVTRDTDGSVRLRLADVNPEGLVTWVLGLGRGVQILSPPGLRKEIGRVARRIAIAHGKRNGKGKR